MNIFDRPPPKNAAEVIEVFRPLREPLERERAYRRGVINDLRTMLPAHQIDASFYGALADADRMLASLDKMAADLIAILPPEVPKFRVMRLDADGTVHMEAIPPGEFYAVHNPHAGHCGARDFVQSAQPPTTPNAEHTHMDAQDAPLETDVAELKREAQKAVDREIAARVELDAAISNRVAVRAMIGGGSADALAFIDAYTNPTVANPAPIAPDVAAPLPVDEPPVFTTVDDLQVDPENTTGGDAGMAVEFEFTPPSEFYPPVGYAEPLPTEPVQLDIAAPPPVEAPPPAPEPAADTSADPATRTDESTTI